MNISAVSNRALGSTQFFLKKHGPTILTCAGVAGFAGAMVLYGKAELKAQEPRMKLRAQIDEIAAKELSEDYTKRDQQQEAGRFYLVESLKILKIYAPAIGVGALSAACIFSSHSIMKERQASIAAAYFAMTEAYQAYRKRVADAIGAEKEKELYKAPRKKIEVMGENELPCEIDDPEDRDPSPYSKVFSRQTSSHFDNTPEYNLFMLRGWERMANDRLSSRGYIFLNEVYESCGLPWTREGQIVGWVRDGDGDCFVSFGLSDIDEEEEKAYLEGYTDGAIRLDFNVDGPILNAL
jgi:Family of unknown function (DUF6353)